MERCLLVAVLTVAMGLGPAVAAPIRAAEAHLTIRTIPGGAAIKIDGATVGSSDLEYNVEPGTHVVEASQKGYQTAHREVHVVPGERQVLTIFLLEQAPAPSGVRVGKWIAAVAGAGALVAGVAMLAVGSGERSEAGMRLPDRHDNTALGAGLLVGGALLSGLAGYLFYRDGASAIAPNDEVQKGMTPQ